MNIGQAYIIFKKNEDCIKTLIKKIYTPVKYQQTSITSVYQNIDEVFKKIDSKTLMSDFIETLYKEHSSLPLDNDTIYHFLTRSVLKNFFNDDEIYNMSYLYNRYYNSEKIIEDILNKCVEKDEK
jgi:Iap family predicted aminopeptidase